MWSFSYNSFKEVLESFFFSLYFHLDKGHCLAETGRSPIYNKVRIGRRWLCILFPLLSFDLIFDRTVSLSGSNLDESAIMTFLAEFEQTKKCQTFRSESLWDPLTHRYPAFDKWTRILAIIMTSQDDNKTFKDTLTARHQHLSPRLHFR